MQTAIVLVFVLCGFVRCMPYKNNDTDVILTHVIFRHGERTTYKFYPNDPYINSTFYPMGSGGLTNKGKLAEYLLGKFLRQEYNNLLGDVYLEDHIEARSTYTERTKQSAQLVLAGLYPPNELQKWHPEIAWQPISVYSKTREEEDLIHPEECARKLQIVDNLPLRPEIQEVYVEPYKNVFKYIEEKSGMPIRTVHDMLEFYFIVNTEEDLNLTLPQWVPKIYPQPLYDISSTLYSYFNFDDELKRINCGYLLQKIFDDTNAKIKGNSKRMYLYSGHETTLGYMLYCLRILKPHIPPYSSALMFEVHKNSQDKYFIKIRYRDATYSTTAKDLVVPGCDVLCPIEQFIGLHQSLLPKKSIKEACALH